MSKLVMGYWDCPVCGSKEIRGDVTNCPSCGRARGDVQFYMKGYNEGEIREEDERADVEYLNEEQAKYVSKNPDWYCSFCNSLNSDNAQFCGNCGSSRADSESNYFQMLQKKKEREAAEAAAQPSQSLQAPQKNGSKNRTLLIVVALALVALLIWFFLPKNQTGIISGFSWARQILTEEYREVTEEDWDVPLGGTLINQAEKIHHYDTVQQGTRSERRSRQIIDHYETYYTYQDNGNGTFTEVPHERPVYDTEYYYVDVPNYIQVPRYQTAYTYKIWRWIDSETFTSSGQDHNPIWPEIPEDETHREKNKKSGDGRYGIYRIIVANEKGEPITYRLNESDWKRNESIWLNLNESESYNIMLSGGFYTLQSGDKKTNFAKLIKE